jgi:hypothetical protein
MPSEFQIWIFSIVGIAIWRSVGSWIGDFETFTQTLFGFS